MRLSTRARYALRMMVDVARHGGGERPVSLAKVSERTEISRAYLEQVALALRNARLVKGVSGRRGGYRLASPTDKITVGRIIEALIGPTSVVDCVDDPETCPRSGSCECRVVYQLINSRIAAVLSDFTLADLLDPNWLSTHGRNGELGPVDPEALEGLEGCGCNPSPRGAGEKRAD